MSFVQTAKSLREKRAKLVSQARGVIEAAARENRALKTDEQEQVDKILGGNDSHTGARVTGEEERLKAEIDRLERLEGVETELGKPLMHPAGGDGAALDDQTPGSRRFKKTRRAEARSREVLRRQAFRAWCLSGTSHVKQAWADSARGLNLDLNQSEFEFAIPRADERKNLYRADLERALEKRGLEQRAGTAPTQTSVVGVTGGYLVPETMMTSVEVALKQYWDLNVVTHIKTTGVGPMIWPMVNDTTTKGVRLTDGVVVNANVVKFSALQIAAYLYSSQVVLLPISLMTDTAVPVDALLGQLLGIRVGRTLADDFTFGIGGAGQPQGIVTGAPQGIQAALPTAISADDVYGLKHSVDPAYRNGPSVRYIFHDQVLLALKKLKSGIGTYLWQAGLASGAPDVIDGTPYVINQSMASTFSTGTKSMVYGDLAKYLVREVQDSYKLVRLVERYMDQGCVGFILYAMYGGALLDAGTHPVAALVH